jgi:hypothetical protein
MAKPSSPPDDDNMEETRRLMGALVRMPPKPHEDMKLGKARKQEPGKASKAKQKPTKRA